MLCREKIAVYSDKSQEARKYNFQSYWFLKQVVHIITARL
jgi:hypothetical protein